MNERRLRATLVKEMRDNWPGAVVLRHEDIYTAGIPDISVTAFGRTLWVEVKFLKKPELYRMSKDAQFATMLALWRSGYSVYVVYGPTGVRVITPDGRELAAWDHPRRHALVTQHLREWMRGEARP